MLDHEVRNKGGDIRTTWHVLKRVSSVNNSYNGHSYFQSKNWKLKKKTHSVSRLRIVQDSLNE